jgi:hypothetical protein
MAPDEQRPSAAVAPTTAPAATPAPAAAAAAADPPSRPHLVVVTTRAARPDETLPPTAVLVTRFWHPGDRCWSENAFESLEHARRLFIDESGWTLLQEQPLDGAHAHELVFEARRADFARPSTEELLRDVGLDPRQVSELLEHVDPDSHPPMR